mmetsp:Transcript_6816/g.17456  ORF Transcript_6816/g.17456 Transcript_6816/m.17456 type:complete len:121 (-) Transcript_6816:856-1218(-)
MAYYELYRRSTLGMTLTDALDEMVTNGELTPTIAMKVLAQFDKCMGQALKEMKTKTTFKGTLDTYRFCDNVWTFILDDVTFNTTGPGGYKDTAHVEKLKIVACDGKASFGADNAGPSSKT